MSRRVLIMGAAGRDFHNFNCLYRHRRDVEVRAFTAEQIPDIAGRIYPPSLAGPLYPEGIPIFEESRLADLILKESVNEVVFAYSDISAADLLAKSALVNSAGADFRLVAPQRTMLRSRLPVVSVCATRTGCGKSVVTRTLAAALKESGRAPVVVRHPMPYGDLKHQAAQRFSTLEQIDEARCSAEEREEYEPLVAEGLEVFAGVDYHQVLKLAESAGDIILWDGGNNDLPFFHSDLHLVLLDPHRAGHEKSYYPSETNLRLAQIALITKVDSASPNAVESVRKSVTAINPEAEIYLGELRIRLDESNSLRGKKVLVIEDGPTLTHGEMAFGAGTLAAEAAGAEIIDASQVARGGLKSLYERYPHLRKALPAMGYSRQQLGDLEDTIAASDAEAVVSGTPMDLRRLLRIDIPCLKVSYSFGDVGQKRLTEAVMRRVSLLERRG